MSIATLLLFVLPLAPPATRTEQAATQAEAAAFRAIDDGAWCEAVRFFLHADALAPNPGLVENAAEAAIEAKDFRLAVELFGRAKTRVRSKKQKRALGQRQKFASGRVGRKGRTAACDLTAPVILEPVTEPKPKPGPSAAVETKAAAPTSSEPYDPFAGAPAPSPPQTSPASEGEVVDDDPGLAHAEAGGTGLTDPASQGGGAVRWTIASLSGALGLGGAGVAVVGAAMAGAAAIPFVQHEAARQELMAAEQEGRDGTEAYQAQQTSRAAWETWGWPLAYLSPAVMTLGVVIVVAGAGGLVTALFWPSSEEASGE